MFTESGRSFPIMASGDHGVDKFEHRFHEDAQPCELKKRIRSASGKTMKEVDYFKKEEINKKRSPVGRTAQNSGKVKRVVSSKRKARQVTVCPGGRRKPSPAVGSCDMANKENELACDEDLHQGLFCRQPLNQPEVTKMDEPGSKYSDYFTELSKDHDAMTQVLFGRNLRLNVALTLWRRNAGELVAYLLRIQDTGVLVDCLPVITKSLQEEKPAISVGCCVDLLPLVKTLLTSQYEEYLVVGLHWVQSVLRRWWPELSVNGRTARDSHSDDKNIHVMKQQLRELWEHGSKLIFLPGTTGEVAKAVESYLSQLR
ncbi:KATNB1-like protein 1 isoform X1 [Paramormyrops kingsleyae]|uniref:KATNB1-like protein 1 isoform X1 n=2 Tax=Paramormyrops kingsleyae TaxID=1676925 RepID=UPI003B97A4B4